MDNIALYLLDLAQNAIVAKANHIDIHIKEDDMLVLEMKDDGCGMDEETLQKASSPFFTTRKTRKVGLGLSMIKMVSEQTSGEFQLTSKPNEGTTLKVSFDIHHMDMPPLGDFGDVIVMLAIHQDMNDFTFTYEKDNKQYIFHLNDMKELLGDTLHDIYVMNYLKDYINQEINRVRGIL